jgi:hypothetical protein
MLFIIQIGETSTPFLLFIFIFLVKGTLTIGMLVLKERAGLSAFFVGGLI